MLDKTSVGKFSAYAHSPKLAAEWDLAVSKRRFRLSTTGLDNPPQ